MLRSTIIIPLLIFTLAIHAAEPPIENKIAFSVSVTESVENDTLQATLYAQNEDAVANIAAARVNEAITRGIEAAKGVDGVQVQTLDYSTQPIYGKGTFSDHPRVTGWRVRQSIRLKSNDTTALSDLLGAMQQYLAISRIGYTTSQEKRRTAQERMIKQAVALFKERATLITREMGANDYRLLQMTVNTPDYTPQPYPMRANLMEAKAMPSPAIEAGTQQMQVKINGSIILP